MQSHSEKLEEAWAEPSGPESGVHVWLILWKAYEAMREYAMGNIESLGIGLTDFGILEILLHKGPTPVNAIGQKIHLTSGSISIAIDRLEAKGLVERRSSPDDRRTRMVHLTSAGRKLIRCAFAAHAKAMEKVARVLSPRERRDAVDLLKRLGQAAADSGPVR
jgi:MarR family transcriptional regulator, 2-MHQ and catechol-resistance regulon repressor